ncbi:hypothetical protein COV18_04985 [Candidatus Woesearchaeota archaeon CG10_big_fil_rev_8_21_14_0_10_37_12]|nr:MAG: hypothetical protein COV18_04985 [Candidatus Woesearchaeota archaeon CG10_big_fil_rev_8_21_14_0_10_37_12]
MRVYFVVQESLDDFRLPMIHQIAVCSPKQEERRRSPYSSYEFRTCEDSELLEYGVEFYRAYKAPFSVGSGIGVATRSGRFEAPKIGETFVIDRDGGYHLGNVVWIAEIDPSKEQNRLWKLKQRRELGC